MQENRWLLTGGALSMLAAILHIAAIIGGPDWYRAFGAAEEMALAAESGSPAPAIMTFAIAVMLGIWALYAFSGAGKIRKLPLLRTGLVVISAIYLARALLLIPFLILKPELVDAFAIWSSLIVLVYGLTYAIGTWRAWPVLAQKAA